MKIHGLQKMTLLDYPGRVACTVFLAGCDLRCPFCHNSGLLDGSAPAAMEEGELLVFLEKRKGILDGVAFTGGEPLLRDLRPLLRRVKALGYPVKLDTNGTHPEALKELLEEGLADYVAMDIKNSPARYGETVGVPDFDPAPVLESARLLLAGRTDYEFRTTVIAEYHDAGSFRAIRELIRGAERYFLQAFTDRESVPVPGLHAPTRAEMEAYAEIVRPCVSRVEIRGMD